MARCEIVEVCACGARFELRMAAGLVRQFEVGPWEAWNRQHQGHAEIVPARHAPDPSSDRGEETESTGGADDV